MNQNLPIYVVNLKKDTDRLAKIAELFPEYYAKFNIIEAVDGRTMHAKRYFESIRDHYFQTKRLITPSELGCTLSHIKALEMFVVSEKPFALIFEDDVIGNDADISQAMVIANTLPINGLAILLAQSQYKASRWIYGKKTQVTDLYQVAPFSYYFILSNCACLVTRHAALHLLGEHRKQLRIADDWRTLLNSSVALYYSNIFSHPQEFITSNIESERAPFHEISMKQKIMSIDFYKGALNYIRVIFLIIVLYFFGYKKITDCVAKQPT